MAPPTPDRVRERLFLGAQASEACAGVLDGLGITHVLQVGVELAPSHPGRYAYLSLPVYDVVEQDLVSLFPAAFSFIDAALASGGAVLVHCAVGVSRSASVVAGYLMAREAAPAAAAVAAVAAARPSVRPNAGFACQLREYGALLASGRPESAWPGWSMDRFLALQYGDESVGFMSGMLGGAPADRLRSPGATLAAEAAAAIAAKRAAAAAGCAGCAAAAGGARVAHTCGAARGGGGGAAGGAGASPRRPQRPSGGRAAADACAAAAAAAGISPLDVPASAAPRRGSGSAGAGAGAGPGAGSGSGGGWVSEEAAIMMAG
ncbi:VH-PTP13 [Scenedesmus sp. PABB004]|nr:VH-PTP13 [Scenedesmus sp. PABB004]